MNDQNYFSVLRGLSEQYGQRKLQEQEYRSKRKRLLDFIEADINGPRSIGDSDESTRIDEGIDDLGQQEALKE